MDKLKQHNAPQVTVCVVTYNQEQYIAQCLQSIVDQKTDFDIEIIISDDCSTDKTREVILEFASKHPNMRPILREKNIGALPNFIATHNMATGEYVCHLDGDDYWLKDKLQSQVEILDSRKGVSYTTHAMKITNATGSALFLVNNTYPVLGTTESLIKLGSYFNNSSVMYRRKNEYAHNNSTKIIDYYLHIERSIHGYVYYDHEYYGVYRHHKEGISKSIEASDELELCYEFAFDRAIELGIKTYIVEKGRMKRRMSFALTRLIRNDILGYKKLINIDRRHIMHVSVKHFILYITKESKYIRRLVKSKLKKSR